MSTIADAVIRLRPEMEHFLQRLVQIPSLPGEEATAHIFVADGLRAMGLDVGLVSVTRAELEAHPAFSDDGLPVETRPNVVGRWPGRGRGTGRSIVLNGHLDVVSPGDERRWSRSPWSGHIEGGRLYGRGSCDMKAGVAAAVFAVRALQQLGLKPSADVFIQTVSGEESGGMGTLATIVRGFRADAAIILEPTELALCPVQAGALTFRLIVPGQLAHAALKNTGVSAIDKLRPILDAIDRLERDRHAAFSHPLYDDPQQVAPVSIGTLRAGDWPSTVPNEVVAEGRFGVFPGESVDAARRALEAAVSAVADADPFLRNHRPTVEWFEGQFESGETPLDAAVVKALTHHHQNVAGHAPRVHGVTYGSDLRLFTNHAGMPAVLYGPGSAREAHAVDEFVELDQVVTACAVVAATVAEWAGCA